MATTEIYTLSLHDALPILGRRAHGGGVGRDAVGRGDRRGGVGAGGGRGAGAHPARLPRPRRPARPGSAAAPAITLLSRCAIRGTAAITQRAASTRSGGAVTTSRQLDRMALTRLHRMGDTGAVSHPDRSTVRPQQEIRVRLR